MNSYAKYFSLVVRVGVVGNLIITIPGILVPGVLFDLLNLGDAVPDVWARLASWLLLLLSLTYLPAANNPFMSKMLSSLTVLARFGGFLFMTFSTIILSLSFGFVLLGVYDLIFGVPQAILLYLAYRANRQPSFEGFDS